MIIDKQYYVITAMNNPPPHVQNKMNTFQIKENKQIQYIHIYKIKHIKIGLYIIL